MVVKTSPWIRTIDASLVISVVLLSMSGLIASYGMGHIEYESQFYTNLFAKHLLFLILGFIMFLFFAIFDHRILKDFGFPLFVCSLIILLLLFTDLGMRVGGSARWLKIKGFIISPTPVAQASVIIYLSSYLSSSLPKRTIKDFFAFILFLIPTFFILFQPDFTSASICVLTGTFIIFISGYRVLYFLLISTPFVFLFLYSIFSAQYRIIRFMAFLNPELDPLGSGYQLLQSYVALAGGGLTGVGFNNGILKYNVPNVHSDFILCSIGEEFGLVGITIIILAFALFAYRGFSASIKARDTFQKLLASGITFIISIQAVLHMGVVSGLLPIIGASLPFISYGGNQLIMNLVLSGILINIASSNKECQLHTDDRAGRRPRRILRFIGNASKVVEKSPLYKVFAYTVLILSFLISVIQLIKWFR